MQRFVRVVVGLVVTFAIGFADVVTGPDFSLSLLYVVVVALLAWRADRLSALVTAFFAAAIYTQASLETSAASVAVVAWNGIGRALIYAGVALLISELRADQSRLRSVDREREEFLSIVAHELRQPIAAIGLAAAALASAPEIGEADRSVLVALRSQARRLNALAEDLLTISRLEGHRLSLALAPVDLREIVETAVRNCDDPQRVVLVPPPDPLPVRADAFRIGQCVDNLISNALKYSSMGAPVEVCVGAPGGVARVEVRDRGVGISREDLPRLFEKYGRVGDPTAVDGVGLGLYLVRLVAEAHGGRAMAKSEGPGRGAAFGIELPLALAA